MTADEFRDLALSFAGATEQSHMNHPDFRAHGRIFATLGYPDTSRGMVKLPLDEQQRLTQKYPLVFKLETGAWGLQGCTSVHLPAAKPDIVSGALESAWRRSAADATKKPRKTAARKSKSTV